MLIRLLAVEVTFFWVLFDRVAERGLHRFGEVRILELEGAFLAAGPFGCGGSIPARLRLELWKQ